MLVDAWGLHDGRCERNLPGDGAHFAGLLFDELALALATLGWIAPPASSRTRTGDAVDACARRDDAAARDWLRAHGADVDRAVSWNGVPLCELISCEPAGSAGS